MIERLQIFFKSKKTKRVFILFCAVFLFCNCKKEHSKTILKSGVAISFDDNYIEEWSKADSLLKKYQWKATFFVTKFNKLSKKEIEELKLLQRSGHEIGGHGLIHTRAKTFIAENGIFAYTNQEINPMFSLMNSKGFSITSFSYPYGSRNTTSDELLFPKFDIIRGTTYGKIDPSEQNCFYNQCKLVYGLGIDNNYPHFSVPYFISLLEYAKKNNKIVLFYAHKPVPKAHNKFESDYQTLIDICEYIHKNNMTFYKMTDLPLH